MDDGKVNALSIEMLKALHGALDQAERDNAVVVLSGRESYLSAGLRPQGLHRRPARIVEMLTLGATLSSGSSPTDADRRRLQRPRNRGRHLRTLAADVRIGVDGPFKARINEVQDRPDRALFVIELARQRLTPRDFDRSRVTAAKYTPREAVEAGFLDDVVETEELREASLDAAEDSPTST